MRTARRNAVAIAATLLTTGALFLFPTSTNGGSHRRVVTHPAPVGVVPVPSTAAATIVRVNGTAANTRYGPVQVQIEVRGHRIVSARAIVYPRGSGRDREINDYAVPLLEQETLHAQSASVDTVSGATYTSDGYTRSLQAALDTAHLGPGG